MQETKRFLSELSEEEFFQKLDEHLERQSRPASDGVDQPKPHGRLVYGLRGIETLFNCSHRTAQYLKDNVLCEAVVQRGRIVVTDVDMALRLFDERRSKNAQGSSDGIEEGIQ